MGNGQDAFQLVRFVTDDGIENAGNHGMSQLEFVLSQFPLIVIHGLFVLTSRRDSNLADARTQSSDPTRALTRFESQYIDRLAQVV